MLSVQDGDGNEVRGFRRVAMVGMGLFILTLFVCAFLAWLALTSFVILPVAALVRITSGRWPSWCQVSGSRA